MEHHLVCLLPVRNGEDDLPEWFASVARFADGVVALDDGSTDSTLKVLKTNPLVKIILENPRRPSYHGWDDAANRQRLLEAAASLSPRWVFFLDADERISADDAAALTTFLRTEALPRSAYGFRVHRMIESLESFDKSQFWVFRLFHYHPSQRLPTERLHLVPVPTQIPRQRWFRTTLRIQHVASLTEARRTARFRKYMEADPQHEHQSDYRNLLDPPKDVKPWLTRPPDLAVPFNPERHRRFARHPSSRRP